MTSSPELDTDAVPMPRGLPAMWRLCKLGYQHEPWLLVAAFVLSLLAAVPDVLLALWLALLGAAVIHHHDGAAIVFSVTPINPAELPMPMNISVIDPVSSDARPGTNCTDTCNVAEPVPETGETTSQG